MLNIEKLKSDLARVECLDKVANLLKKGPSVSDVAVPTGKLFGGLGNVAGGLLNGAGEIVEGTGNFLSGAANMADKATTWAASASVAAGVAAAYLAYKMNQLAPDDIKVDRKRFYRNELLDRIGEIRRDQAIKATPSTEKTRSLRLQ